MYSMVLPNKSLSTMAVNSPSKRPEGSITDVPKESGDVSVMPTGSSISRKKSKIGLALVLSAEKSKVISSISPQAYSGTGLSWVKVMGLE